MLTGVSDEIGYCSRKTYSAKQKENGSASQTHFHNQDTPVTIEVDQRLLALQKLANNTNSTKFNSINHRISKLPKSLTTTLPTFDGKSARIELFEELFQISHKIDSQTTGDNKVNYLHSLMAGVALQTFENINRTTPENVGEILAVFRRKNLKAQAMATAKHEFQKLVINTASQELIDFLDEIGAGQSRIRKSSSPHHWTILIRQNASTPDKITKKANLEHGASEQIVTHLNTELKIYALETPNELQVKNFSQNAINTNSESAT